MRRCKICMTLMSLVALLLAVVPVQGRVKLASLPERGMTIIRMENPQATLVEEERVLTLQKGLNRVDFSWKGVNIDPDSIRLTLLSHPEQVTLLNVSYPPNEAALVWEIASTDAWEEKVRVTYLLAYIDRLIAYNGVADREEQRLDFKGNLVIRNFSGEDFQQARVLLDFGEAFDTGMSHEETKQFRLFRAVDVPLEKVWNFDATVQPWDPEKLDQNVGIPVSYRIRNTAESGLGKFAIPEGKVRVFQNDGHGGTIFLGEDRIGFVARGEKADIRIGDSRDIVVTQRKMHDKKINVRYNKENKIVLYDTDELITAKIENFKDKPAVLTMIQHIPGQWDMEKCNFKYTLKDAYTLEFEIHLSPNGKTELNMHYHRRNVK